MHDTHIIWAILLVAAFVYGQIAAQQWHRLIEGEIPLDAWPLLIIIGMCSASLVRAYSRK